MKHWLINLEGGIASVIVSALDTQIKCRRFKPWTGLVLCSWEKYFTFTVPLSPPRSINGYWRYCCGNQIKCWGVMCNALASHPGVVTIPPVDSCLACNASVFLEREC